MCNAINENNVDQEDFIRRTRPTLTNLMLAASLKRELAKIKIKAHLAMHFYLI